MSLDLSFLVVLVCCLAVRDSDGLAMSRRNAYLTPDERAAAPVVHRALQAGVARIEAGERDPAAVRAVMAGVIDAEPLGQLDYAEVVEATPLAVPEPLAGTLRTPAAVPVGKDRHLDNVPAEGHTPNPPAGAKPTTAST